MKTSESGIALIKRFEGLELESYLDIADVWTIGYGHTETAGPNQRISEREAEDLLKRDLKPREKAVDQLTNVPLNQNEFDALVSFVYNVGIDAYRGSTARKRLNKGDRLGAADALTWWNKATVDGVLRPVTGLTRRRAAERGIFITPVNPPIVSNPDNVDENSRITPEEDSPRRTSLGESRTIQGATVAGGAGAAAASMGRDSAEELDQIETEIEGGEGAASDHHSHEPGDDSHDESTGGTSHNGHDEELVPPGQSDPSDSTDDETPEEEAHTEEEDAHSEDDIVDGTEEPADSDDVDSSDSETEDGPTPEDETPEDPSDIPDVETDPADEFPPLDGPSTDDTIATTETGPLPPAKHEKHAADAQIQLALLIMIGLSVLYIMFARFDDWSNHRR